MSSIDVEAFQRKGYAVVPLFSADEAEAMRQQIVDEVERHSRDGTALSAQGPAGLREYLPGDALTYEPLRRVMLDRRIIEAVTQVLGGQPVYWGECGVAVGTQGGGARSWHTDAYDTPTTYGPDYPLVRCGLYFQDTKRHSAGLGLIEGSHLRDWYSTSILNKVRTRARPWLGARRTVLVPSSPTDLVIWDMRILHTGEVVRFKPAPSLPLPLYVQAHLPAALALPEERRRVVMFPTFGLPGPDLDSYLERRKARQDQITLWENSSFPDSVIDEAAAVGLTVIRPVPYYGSGLVQSAV